MTTNHLFVLLEPHVRKIVRAEVSWANDRLAIIGSNADFRSLGLKGRDVPIVTPRSLRSAGSTWNSQISKVQVGLIYQGLHYPGRSQGWASTKAVLRNLNKKKFVRASVLTESDDAYSLGKAICVQTQYTNDPSELGGLDRCGSWARDRFDLADITDVDADDTWTDVSQGAIDLLALATKEEEENGESESTGIAMRGRKRKFSINRLVNSNREVAELAGTRLLSMPTFCPDKTLIRNHQNFNPSRHR